MNTNLAQLPVKQLSDEQRRMVEILTEFLADVRNGNVADFEIVYTYKNGTWNTRATASADSRVCAAMLMELAMRRLGVGS